MEKEGFIQIGESREIALTSGGRLLAERMIRRHRLAARMIVDLLGMELQVVNAQAHMLEHAMSEDLEKSIASRLGHPNMDPFGQPIPGSSYKPRKDVITLDHAREQSVVVIDRIPEEDEELIKYLVECAVLPGVEVTVQEVAPYRGVVGIKVGDRTAVLGYGVAGRIHVRPAQAS
jgi:DtxR family Mn-dependent transcriptional regulator